MGEPLTQAHHGELARLLGHPRVGETLLGMQTPAQVQEWITRHMLHWDGHGYGQLVWHLRESGEFVGRGGLLRSEVDGKWETEVGWAVMPELWGRGYATELGAASVEHGFRDLGLSEIVAFTLPENVASWRVMEKLGFSFEKEFQHAGLPHHLYRRRRKG